MLETVENYCTHTGDVLNSCQDRYGRSLLPLDEVMFEYKSDNGQNGVLIHGAVSGLHKLGSGEWIIKVETHSMFVEAGFDKVQLLTPEMVVRTPQPCTMLYFELRRLLAIANRASIERGGVVINGKDIKSAP